MLLWLPHTPLHISVMIFKPSRLWMRLQLDLYLKMRDKIFVVYSGMCGHQLPSMWCVVSTVSVWFWVLFMGKESDRYNNSFYFIILSHQSCKKFNLIDKDIKLWINQLNGLAFSYFFYVKSLDWNNLF